MWRCRTSNNTEFRLPYKMSQREVDSGQGEAERTNSATEDALADGATIDREFEKDLLI